MEREYRRRPEIKEQNRKRMAKFQNDPTKWHLVVLSQARYRAKKKGLEFNITKEDILPIPEFCPILGIKLERVRGSANALSGYTSPTIDRIDNTKGYVKGNVHVISMRANHIKRDASFDEIEKLYLYLKERLQSL